MWIGVESLAHHNSMSTTIESVPVSVETPANGVGVAKAAISTPLASSLTPLPALEPIQDRIANLRHQLGLAEQEEKRRSEVAKATRALASKEQIAALPGIFEQPDLLGVIHLLAESAGLDVRLYRVGTSQRGTVAPKVNRQKKGVHSKGFRLTEHQRGQIKEALKVPNCLTTDLMKRFGVSSQTVYSYKARLLKEQVTEGRRKTG